jgi:hypothetical protein
MYNQKLRTFSEMMQMGGMPQEAAPAQAMPQQGMPQQGGGNPEEMIQQLMQMVMQALQQGTDPQQIVSMLVEQGIPQDQAGQIVEATMQQMQGGAPQGQMRMGGYNEGYQMGGLRKSPMEAMKNYISPEQYNYLKRFM